MEWTEYGCVALLVCLFPIAGCNCLSSLSCYINGFKIRAGLYMKVACFFIFWGVTQFFIYKHCQIETVETGYAKHDGMVRRVRPQVTQSLYPTSDLQAQGDQLRDQQFGNA